MKRLFLLRHANAEMDSPDGSDFERPLSARGRADAERLGREIRASGLDFDLVLASPARRVVETIEAVDELAATLDPRFYNASAEQLLETIHGVDDGVGRLLLVGHNPGMGQLAAQLAASAIDDLPTAALAEIALAAGDWGNVETGCGRMTRFITPASLG